MPKLTDPSIADALAGAAPGVQIELRDSTGLVLRATRNPRGDASGGWSVRCTHQGQRRRLSIGPWPGLKIGAARAALSVALGKLAKGEDIFEAAAGEKRAAKDAITIAAALDRYEAEVLAKRRTKKHTAQVLRRFFAPMLDRLMSSVSHAEIGQRFNRRKGEAPAAARLAMAYAKPFWAHFHLEGQTSFLLTIKAGQARSRERVLSVDELRAIWAWSGTLDYPYRGIVRVLMLTGLRLNEVAGLRAAEVAFDTKTLHIPGARMKLVKGSPSGVDFDVPVTAEAIAEIRLAMKSAPKKNPRGLVFASSRGTVPAGWSTLKADADAVLGFAEPWVWHDFRRSLSTLLPERGLADPVVADLMLAHRPKALSSASKHYFKTAMLDARRAAAAAWAELLLDVKPAAVGETAGAEAA